MARATPSPWESLPPEIWRMILCKLSMDRLRLFKLVSRDMANHCRWVLRSKQWQAWVANAHAMQMEVNAHAGYQSYTLPLTVRLLEDNLKDPPCIATIYRLKCKLYDWHEAIHLDANVPDNWERFTKGGHVELDVVDMLMEVHGVGIVSSVYGLRKLLGDELRERGDLGLESLTRLDVSHEDILDHIIDSVDGTKIYQDENPTDTAPGHGCVDEGYNGEMDIWELFRRIVPVTDTGAEWRMHRTPNYEWNDGEHHTRYWVDVITVGANTPGLLT